MSPASLPYKARRIGVLTRALQCSSANSPQFSTRLLYRRREERLSGRVRSAMLDDVPVEDFGVAGDDHVFAHAFAFDVDRVLQLPGSHRCAFLGSSLDDLSGGLRERIHPAREFRCDLREPALVAQVITAS